MRTSEARVLGPGMAFTGLETSAAADCDLDMTEPGTARLSVVEPPAQKCLERRSEYPVRKRIIRCEQS